MLRRQESAPASSVCAVRGARLAAEVEVEVVHEPEEHELGGEHDVHVVARDAGLPPIGRSGGLLAGITNMLPQLICCHD